MAASDEITVAAGLNASRVFTDVTGCRYQRRIAVHSKCAPKESALGRPYWADLHMAILRA